MAGKRLVKLGTEALLAAAAAIRKDFSDLETSKLPPRKVDWNRFGIWHGLLARFEEEWQLDHWPYAADQKFLDMDIGDLVDFCELHGGTTSS